MKLINVLSPYYYADCHIPGSINIPLSELAEKANTLDKNEEIILYCAHYECDASKKAWYILHELGFTNIAAYEGGIVEWYQLGFPVEGSASEAYLQEPHTQPEDSDSQVTTISAQQLRQKLSL